MWRVRKVCMRRLMEDQDKFWTASHTEKLDPDCNLIAQLAVRVSSADNSTSRLSIRFDHEIQIVMSGMLKLPHWLSIYIYLVIPAYLRLCPGYLVRQLEYKYAIFFQRAIENTWAYLCITRDPQIISRSLEDYLRTTAVKQDCKLIVPHRDWNHSVIIMIELPET